MKRPKLTYEFHNPNDINILSKYLANIIIENSREKIDKLIHSSIKSENDNNDVVSTLDKAV